MPAKDKLDLSNKNILDVLVDYRQVLVSAVVIITAMLCVFSTGIQTDPSLKSALAMNSPAFIEYQKFGEVFGNEEFFLIAMKNDRGAGDPAVLEALKVITQKLEKQDNVSEVISLANLRLFQEKDKRFGNYPFLKTKDGSLLLPDKAELEKFRKALPVMDFLLSRDLKTVGILVHMPEKWKFDPVVVKPLAADISRIVKENSPPGTEYRMIGPALIRQAVVRYSVQTAIVFGILCLGIATVVTVYIFKSLRITAITNAILIVCVVWILGLMSVLGIPLNSTTALSFGFIPITTLEIVIHMVIRYHQFHKSESKIGAVKQAVRWLIRPCFMCSATTAVGFGSLMVSSIPMVRQLGFIMSVGIMISYCLAFILTPAFFIRMKSLDAPETTSVLRDWLDQVLGRILKAIFSHHGLFVLTGFVITAFLFAGTPMIRSDIQILRFLSQSTPEVQDFKFVEANLTNISFLELMLESDDHMFKDPQAWKKVFDLEKNLREIPEVVSTESLLPLLEYLDRLTNPGTKGYGDLFTNPKLIPQLLVLFSLSPETQKLRRSFLDDDFDRVRVAVRIKNSPSVPIAETIEQVRLKADSVMKGTARVTVTGDLAMYASQTSDYVEDQIHSMFLASILITILMIIQMGSIVLGLISLLPNIPPVAAVFGIMGWFGVSLDGVTVFAATVAIGLAVDNTIHYLAQLKRDIRFRRNQPVESLVGVAYQLTAKQIASWTTVTLLGFLALAVSPFRPVVLFGILGCSAITLGLFGDLVFMQSLILTSARIRNTITKLVEKEMAAEK